MPQPGCRSRVAACRPAASAAAAAAAAFGVRRRRRDVLCSAWPLLLPHSERWACAHLAWSAQTGVSHTDARLHTHCAGCISHDVQSLQMARVQHQTTTGLHRVSHIVSNSLYGQGAGHRGGLQTHGACMQPSAADPACRPSLFCRGFVYSGGLTRMRRVVHDMVMGKPVRIAAIGGSVTADGINVDGVNKGWWALQSCC